MTKKIRMPSSLSVIFFASLFCAGLFNEYFSCLVSIALAVWLAVNHIKKKETVFYSNLTSWSVVIIVLFYGICSLWAVDTGVAILGFFKYLPVLFFLICLMQTEDREKILSLLPYVAGVMVIISSVFTFIPFDFFQKYFVVAGRLAGFFQYPNTFALFVLVAELLLVSKNKLKIADLVTVAVLLAGIVYTGSRTVFILAFLSNIAVIMLTKGKKAKLCFLGVVALMAVGVGLYFLISGGLGVFGRFADISLKESTFVGRILYVVDALPEVLKHPFGMGYLGYYFTQGSFQTGVYTVTTAHNDLVQIMLDVGWIPGIAFVAVVIKAVLSKKNSLARKIILITVFLHCLFDFNLQFVSMFFVIILFLDYDTGKKKTIKKHTKGVCVTMGILAVLSLYFGVALFVSWLGYNDVAERIYPYNTTNSLLLLQKEEDKEKAYILAEDILERNEYAYLANSVKARYLYSKGDFANLIECKDHIIEIAPFTPNEYEEYAQMLSRGIMLYSQAGDMYSVEVCTDKIISVKEMVDNIEDKLSPLGKLIKDQPEVWLSDDMREYIEELEAAK